MGSEISNKNDRSATRRPQGLREDDVGGSVAHVAGQYAVSSVFAHGGLESRRVETGRAHREGRVPGGFDLPGGRNPLPIDWVLLGTSKMLKAVMTIRTAGLRQRMPCKPGEGSSGFLMAGKRFHGGQSVKEERRRRSVLDGEKLTQ